MGTLQTRIYWLHLGSYTCHMSSFRLHFFFIYALARLSYEATKLTSLRALDKVHNFSPSFCALCWGKASPRDTDCSFTSLVYQFCKLTAATLGHLHHPAGPGGRRVPHTFPLPPVCWKSPRGPSVSATTREKTKKAQ